MINVEQIAATNKANLDNLFGLSNKAFAGVEKMVELNLTASRAALAESAAHAQAVMGVKDAQEFIALQTSFVQPLAEKSAAYSRHIYDIAQGTGAEFTKGLEGKAAEGQHAVQSYIESALKNAPAGSESAVAMMKSAISASQTAIESVQKAVKQATEAAESNLHAMANTATATAKPASRKR